MGRNTLRIVPVDSDSYSDSDSSIYSGTPVTPQFIRCMREYRRQSIDGALNVSYINESPMSSRSTTSITSVEYNRKIACQNRCLIRGGFTCVISAFIGLIACF